MVPQLPGEVDVAEASRLTGLSEEDLARRVELGTLNAVKRGNRHMIPLSELSRHGLLTGNGNTPRQEVPIPPAARPVGVEPGMGNVTYFWYAHPWLRTAGILAAIAVVALLVWLLLLRSSGTQVPTAGGGPVAAS